ncbi:nicotinate (nicotinamide) nucleotide adenylyltransferase [Macrococcoides goetzii]|uniref:nicotinate (nicotinamide) nucleotide adenylyltransferase n=1 Tax=Macrococcus sp. PK TaxID=2801919 RepID=UPI001F0E036F|nr:nicotinate (nicotinamide) nucleotide adenylyltransferase [Macrococcus sp. PK]MCH4984157.1 nicotinate (nicotinamide) nucleotide adenylyltransferase [Macrococcus sp. PK]
MKIIVYGGSFDPVHIGHLTVANEVFHQEQPDMLLFIPTGHSPLKKSGAHTSNNARISMLKLAIDYLGFGEIDTVEMHRKGKSYTYDTMRYLQDKYPGADISVIIGTDQYISIAQWYEIEKLKEMVRFIVVNRDIDTQELPEPFIAFNIPRMDISSTMIRNRIAQRKTIRCFVIDTIERLIRKEHLYEAEES